MARAQIRSVAVELEAKARSRTAELEATLADQRSMTRAISHDLRQPLRHIAGLTKLLPDALADGLDDGHRDQMVRVCRATARVDRMVDALLTNAWKFTRGRGAAFFFTLSPGDG